MMAAHDAHRSPVAGCSDEHAARQLSALTAACACASCRRHARINAVIDEQYSRAVLAYIGKVGQHDARAREDRVAAAVGDLAPDLVARIRAMLDDLYSAELPLWNSRDIADVGRRATTWLRDRYPELSDDAIGAVSNQFAFDWK
jgi:hypothetical protein